MNVCINLNTDVGSAEKDERTRGLLILTDVYEFWTVRATVKREALSLRGPKVYPFTLTLVLPLGKLGEKCPPGWTFSSTLDILHHQHLADPFTPSPLYLKRLTLHLQYTV